MNNGLYIREWGRLRLGDENQQISVDEVVLSHSAWHFLADFASSKLKQDAYLTFQSPKVLQVQNYVGVITTPDGTQIEILPKTSDEFSDEVGIKQSRKLLLKMLRSVDGVFPIQSTEAFLNLEKMPLPEVLIHFFLELLTKVVRKGIRRDYQRIESEEKFLKGRLLVAQQLRQSPAKQHLFHIEYDVFSEDRAENRLIHSALVSVSKWTQNAFNQKRSRELRFAFDYVPESANYANDFSQWRTSRDMIYYQPLLPWLRLILNQQSPFATKDKHAGISFLFPMEMLFEKYVFKKLSKQLPKPLTLKEQVSTESLAFQERKRVFSLKPDLAIFDGKVCRAVLDTKWKRINQNQTYESGNIDRKAGISQSDMYQLFAYGMKYLNGQGRMMLIYPKWGAQQRGFIEPLKSFKLADELYLDVVPFCLESELLVEQSFNWNDWLNSY